MQNALLRYDSLVLLLADMCSSGVRRSYPDRSSLLSHHCKGLPSTCSPSQAPKVPPPPQCPFVRPFIASFSVLRCRSPVGCSFAQVLRFFHVPCIHAPTHAPSDPIFVIIVIAIPSARSFFCFRIDSLQLATARFCVFHSNSFCPPQPVLRPSVLPCSRPYHPSNIFSHLPRPRTFPLSHNAFIPSATFAPLRRHHHPLSNRRRHP